MSGDAFGGGRFFEESVAPLFVFFRCLATLSRTLFGYFGGLGDPKWLPFWSIFGSGGHARTPWAPSQFQGPPPLDRLAPFLVILGPNWASKGSQNRAQIEKNQSKNRSM